MDERRVQAEHKPRWQSNLAKQIVQNLLRCVCGGHNFVVADKTFFKQWQYYLKAKENVSERRTDLCGYI